MAAPTENQIASLTQQLEEDELSVLEGYRTKAERQMIYMLPYILPTDQRLLLIEWLFEQCEPGIFQTSDFLAGESEKVTNIELACRQYGIRQQGKRSLEFSIKGTNGITEAINFLWEIVDFTRELLLFENLQNPLQTVANNVKLINFISQNSDSVFTEKVRLFSPGFPKLDDNEHEQQSKLEATRDELNEHIVQWQKEYEQLQASFDSSLAHNTTDESFEKLESSLKETREQIVTFKQECESGLRTKLLKIQENNLSGVEPLVHSVYAHRIETGKVSDNVSSILSTLNELQS